MSLWPSLLITIIGSLIGGSAVTLVYQEWARRISHHASAAHGLGFKVYGKHVESNQTTGYITTTGDVRLKTIGPGTKHNIQFILWINDEVVHVLDPRIARLTNEHPPVYLRYQHARHEDEPEPQIGLGATWPAPYKRGFRHEYVRHNYSKQRTEVWQWKRFGKMRRWWNYERRFQLPFSGKRRPIGEWVDVPNPDLAWTGPPMSQIEHNATLSFRAEA